MTKGYWALENIQAAKRLVNEIVAIAEEKGTLEPSDVSAVIQKAREIKIAVRNNQQYDIRLPL